MFYVLRRKVKKEVIYEDDMTLGSIFKRVKELGSENVNGYFIIKYKGNKIKIGYDLKGKQYYVGDKNVNFFKDIKDIQEYLNYSYGISGWSTLVLVSYTRLNEKERVASKVKYKIKYDD